MTHEHSPRTTGDNSFEQEPVTHDSFEKMSRDEVRDYVGNQIDRLSKLSEVRTAGAKDNAWEQDNGFIEGGAQYADFLTDISRNGELHSDDQKLAVLYMDSVITMNEARSLIDEKKVGRKYKLSHDTIEALGLQLDDDAVSVQAQNDKFADHIQKETNFDGTPATAKNIEGMKSTIVPNKGVIRDALAAASELRTPTNPELTGKYISELIARDANNPEMTDEEFADARIDLFKKMRRNVRSARAFTHLAKGDRRYVDETTYTANDLEKTAKDLAEKNKEAVRFAYGRTGDIDSEEVVSDDDDLDDDDIAQRAALLAAQAQARRQAARNTANPPIPGGTPPRPPVTPPANPPAGNPPAGTPPTPPNPPQPGAGTGGAQPPANPPQPGATGGNARPPRANTGGAASALDAQKNLVKNAQERLAESGRKRSAFRFGGSEWKVGEYHDDLNQKAFDLMALERPDLVNNPNGLNNEQLGSLIANYATKQYDETLTKSTDGLFDKNEKKDSKKMKFAKVAGRMGLMAVAGFMAGPAGTATVGAIMTGLRVGKAYERKGREHLASAIKEHQAEAAVLRYIERINSPANQNSQHPEVFTPEGAYKEAGKGLRNQFEQDYVKARRTRIQKAIGLGAITGVGGTVLIGGALDAIPWGIDNVVKGVSWLSWHNTGASWDGGLNPNVTYGSHPTPFSLDALKNSFDYTNKSFF